MTHVRSEPLSLLDAYQQLLTMSQCGFPFEARQVLHFDHPEDIKDDGGVQAGTGFMLARQLPFDSDQVADRVAIATMQVMHFDLFPPAKLHIRVDTFWRSCNGSRHHVKATLSMGEDDLERAILLSAVGHIGDDTRVTVDAPMTVAGFLAEQYLHYGITWSSEHHDGDDRRLEPHQFLPAVKALRRANPGMLGLLADTYVGAFEPDALVGVRTWLGNQPETQRYLPGKTALPRSR
jgi:hypothetical protein